jgi:hypothetical protein
MGFKIIPKREMKKPRIVKEGKRGKIKMFGKGEIIGILPKL